jgi:hypothetical protein
MSRAWAVLRAAVLADAHTGDAGVALGQLPPGVSKRDRAPGPAVFASVTTVRCEDDGVAVRAYQLDAGSPSICVRCDAAAPVPAAPLPS